LIGLARHPRALVVTLPATIVDSRGVPLVMVIFWFWFIIPTLLGKSLPEYSIALTAFVIFEAAYLAEIVRAGIQSVSRGQVEAATATGLTQAQMMRHVILPQALRNMIPALATQFIVLLKDTSLASIIGYVDLTKAAQIVNNRRSVWLTLSQSILAAAVIPAMRAALKITRAAAQPDENPAPDRCSSTN
jgi:His/Glu/Gln/Arg/opine family amino acid ABC transporter permease subunit